MPSLLTLEPTILLKPLIGHKLHVKSLTADGWVVNLQTQVQGKIRVRVHHQSQGEYESCKGLFTRREGNRGSWVTLALTR